MDNMYYNMKASRLVNNSNATNTSPDTNASTTNSNYTPPINNQGPANNYGNFNSYSNPNNNYNNISLNTSSNNQTQTNITSKGSDVIPTDLVTESSDPIFRFTVFLSYATPFNDAQMAFLDRIIKEMRNVLLFPRTLQIGDQETEVPITGIKRMILSSYGLIGIAFRRTLIKETIVKPGTSKERVYTSGWLTSPYLQIEPLMAYQQGLPVLLLVEDGVITDGIFGGALEPGVTPLYIPRFNLDHSDGINAFFNSSAWKELFIDWVGKVRAYYATYTTNTEMTIRNNF